MCDVAAPGAGVLHFARRPVPPTGNELMPATCPALEDTCPVCPASARCELVAGGWPLIAPAFEGMPAPEKPQTRPVALTAPVESRLGPPPPPPQPQPAPLTPAGPRRIVWRNGTTGNRAALNHGAQYPVKTAAAPAVSPGKRPLPGIAMPFMPRGTDVAGIAQMTPAAAYDAGYMDGADWRARRRRIYQGEGTNADYYAEGWYAAARARWRARQ